MGDFSPVGHVSQDVPSEIAIQKQPRDLAKEWFDLHPEHLNKPGRWLEENATPEGITISYKTWNRAKNGYGHKEGLS